MAGRMERQEVPGACAGLEGWSDWPFIPVAPPGSKMGQHERQKGARCNAGLNFSADALSSVCMCADGRRDRVLPRGLVLCCA